MTLPDTLVAEMFVFVTQARASGDAVLSGMAQTLYERLHVIITRTEEARMIANRESLRDAQVMADEKVWPAPGVYREDQLNGAPPPPVFRRG